MQALAAHIGGAPSVAQCALLEQASDLRLMRRVLWSAISRAGVLKAGEPRAVLDAYRRVAADEREVLKLLGLERRSRELSLGQVLSEEQRDGSS